MKYLLMVLFTLLLITACATDKMTMQPMCRHTSVLCAITAGEFYPVRIIHGEVYSGEHAEAQAYVGNKWRRLRFNNGKVEIVEKKAFWIVIYKYVTVEYAVKWSTERFKTIK